MKKIKKICKCGRIFIDTEDNKLCPICANKKHKIMGFVGIGGITLGVAFKRHKKNIIEGATNVIRFFKK